MQCSTHLLIYCSDHIIRRGTHADLAYEGPENLRESPPGAAQDLAGLYPQGPLYVPLPPPHV